MTTTHKFRKDPAAHEPQSRNLNVVLGDVQIIHHFLLPLLIVYHHPDGNLIGHFNVQTG